jgi:hypothetical protein
MKNQAKYHVKEKSFHGNYTSPKQGKKPEQYQFPVFILSFLFAIIFGAIFFVGLWTAGSWLWNLITGAL